MHSSMYKNSFHDIYLCFGLFSIELTWKGENLSVFIHDSHGHVMVDTLLKYFACSYFPKQVNNSKQ